MNNPDGNKAEKWLKKTGRIFQTSWAIDKWQPPADFHERKCCKNKGKSLALGTKDPQAYGSRQSDFAKNETEAGHRNKHEASSFKRSFRFQCFFWCDPEYFYRNHTVDDSVGHLWRWRRIWVTSLI